MRMCYYKRFFGNICEAEIRIPDYEIAKRYRPKKELRADSVDRDCGGSES